MGALASIFKPVPGVKNSTAEGAFRPTRRAAGFAASTDRYSARTAYMFIQRPSASDSLDPEQPEARAESVVHGVLTVPPAARQCRWAEGSMTARSRGRQASARWALQVHVADSQPLTWTAAPPEV